MIATVGGHYIGATRYTCQTVQEGIRCIFQPRTRDWYDLWASSEVVYTGEYADVAVMRRLRV